MTPPVPPDPEDLQLLGGDPVIGEVADFDEARGIGTVEYGVGHRLPFHCTAISDGSRRIAVGSVVAFAVAAGRLGRLEARSVRPLPGVVPPGSSLVAGTVGTGDDEGPPADEEPRDTVEAAGSRWARRAQPVPEAPAEPSGSSGSDPPERAEPRPDFSAPFRRPSAGPPPTWRTPATPGPSRTAEEE